MSGLTISIIGGLIAAVIIALIKREELLSILREAWLLILVQKHLRQLSRELRKHSPDVQNLLSRIAYTTVVHLFKNQQVTLDEYGDLLEFSLGRNLKECIFVARTKPSQWYPETFSSDTDVLELYDEKSIRKVDLERRIQEYFNKQKKLAKNKDEKDRIKLRRYVVLEKSHWNSDPLREKFINDHKDAGIELYYCDAIPKSLNWKEIAIFVSKKGKKWAVEGLNFGEETIQKYLDGAEAWIEVRIEEGAILETEYTHKLKTLDRNAEQVVSFGLKFYYEVETN